MNTQWNIWKKINSLKTKLKMWEYEYYALNDPTVDDDVYDLTLKELKTLEKNNLQFYDVFSPTNNVGGYLKQANLKFQHQTPMLSLDNAFSKEDFLHFFNNCQKAADNKKISFIIEPKIDGSSISLIYENNKLVKALTRGNGKIGENVTRNIKTIKAIPLITPKGPGNYEVRGEIYINKSDFEIYNQELFLESKKLAVNPRNAAAGALRLKKSSEVAKKPLQAVFYQLIYNGSNQLKNQSDIHEVLKKWGFQTLNSDYVFVAQDFESLWAFIDKFKDVKNNLDIPCDGLVIKVDQFNLHELIGYTTKFPKWAIAYKFPYSHKNTKLKNIIGTVGRTGKISYVAELEPVELNGSVISNALLHNANYIQSKDIRINDVVALYKAGEIIPKIIGAELSLRPNNTEIWKPLINCPSCETELEWTKNMVDQFCVNENCIEKNLAKIDHWCSREAMNIEYLSKKTIEKFFNWKIVKNISDLYSIKNNKDFFLTIKRSGIKDLLFNKLVDSIEASKKNSLEKLIFGLGIANVGAKLALNLAKYFLTLDNLSLTTEEKLMEYEEIGPVVAQSIVKWFADPNNQQTVEQLKQLGLNMNYLSYNENWKIKESFLMNKKVVITGELHRPRNEIKKILENQFLVNFQSVVSSKTDFLIVGDLDSKSSSKLQKANQLGIKIINKEEIEELIKNEN